MTIIDMKDIHCKKCRMPHSLDENGLCAFHRRPMDVIEGERPYSDWTSLKNLLVVIALVLLAYAIFSAATGK